MTLAVPAALYSIMESADNSAQPLSEMDLVLPLMAALPQSLSDEELRALYTDPRSINLRNQVAHGLAPHALLGRGLRNWVVHSLLLLGSLRANEPPPVDVK